VQISGKRAMQMEKESENTEGKGIFDEIPPHDQRHPVNYVQYLGNIMCRYRREQSSDNRSATKFGQNVLSDYFGNPVDRNRIARAERGDVTVSFGVFAAYFSEMDVWPEIIKAIDTSHASSLHYLLLVEREISPQIKQAVETANQKLAERADQELNR